MDLAQFKALKQWIRCLSDYVDSLLRQNFIRYVGDVWVYADYSKNICIVTKKNKLIISKEYINGKR